MLVEKVLGNISDDQFKNKNIDYVDIEWHEAFKKLHKKISQTGIEVGIKLDNDILTRGLRQGDVLAIDNDNVIAVNIPKDKALVVKVNDVHLVPKVCYEIGNRHATLFEGNNHNEFITIYNEPMKEMLEKRHQYIANQISSAEKLNKEADIKLEYATRQELLAYAKSNEIIENAIRTANLRKETAAETVKKKKKKRKRNRAEP